MMPPGAGPEARGLTSIASSEMQRLGCMGEGCGREACHCCVSACLRALERHALNFTLLRVRFCGRTCMGDFVAVRVWGMGVAWRAGYMHGP